MIGHLARADGAEQDGVELGQGLERVVGQHPTGAEVVLRPHGNVSVSKRRALELDEHANRHRAHFRSDPVARDDRDPAHACASCQRSRTELIRYICPMPPRNLVNLHSAARAMAAAPS